MVHMKEKDEECEKIVSIEIPADDRLLEIVQLLLRNMDDSRYLDMILMRARNLERIGRLVTG